MNSSQHQDFAAVPHLLALQMRERHLFVKTNLKSNLPVSEIVFVTVLGIMLGVLHLIKLRPITAHR
jgi:hypothetical protein